MIPHKDKQNKKELAKQAFMEGYSEGQDVEELDDISVKTAERLFEQWWEVNVENE